MKDPKQFYQLNYWNAQYWDTTKKWNYTSENLQGNKKKNQLILSFNKERGKRS